VLVGEVGRVEIETDATGLGPAEPAGEMLRLEFVAIHVLVAGLGVEGVEVEALFAGEELQHLIEIGAHLVAVAGAAGIAAGRHDPAAGEAILRGLEAPDVVRLPAMQGDGHPEGVANGSVGVHAEIGVAGAGELVGGGDLFGGRHGGSER
jgi:hypothetical protein